MKKIKCLKLVIKVNIIFWILSYSINSHAYETCGSDDWIIECDYDVKELNKKFKKIQKKMSPNDQEIKVAEQSKDFSEQFLVYKTIIERSRKAADFAEKHGRCKTMKIYRDYQYMVEKKLETLIHSIEQNPFIQEKQEIEDNELHSILKSINNIFSEKKIEEAFQEGFDWGEKSNRIFGSINNFLGIKQIYEAEKKFNWKSEFSQEKNNFEQEGNRYEHLRRNFNDGRIKEADQSRNLDNQIWAREKTCQELRDLIHIGEIFIHIVNDWNNKWGTYETIEKDHPWSPENIQKNVAIDVYYKDILRDEIEDLHEKRYKELKIKAKLQGFKNADIFDEEELIDHSLHDEDYDYNLQ